MSLPRQPARRAVAAASGALLLLVLVVACSTSNPNPVITPSGSLSPSATATASTPGPGQTSSTPTGGNTTSSPTGDRVIATRTSHNWDWPGPGAPFKVTHQYPIPIAQPPAPPLPYLYSIGVGTHPTETPAYDRMSFRFKGAFPSYEVEYTPQLIADGSGQTIPMPGVSGILRVTFRNAQAHLLNGHSSIVSAPGSSIGYKAIRLYKPAGDFEGVVTYGLGIGKVVSTNPQVRVRLVEVEKIEHGQHLYVVSIDFDLRQLK